MKHTLLTSLFIQLTVILYCQDIHVKVAPTIGIAPYYLMVTGGPGQKFKAGFNTSADYYFKSDSRLNNGFGLSYQYSQAEFTPNMNTGEFGGQVDRINIIVFKLLSSFEINDKTHLIFNPLIEFQLNYDDDLILDNQSGIGFALAFEKRYLLNEKADLIIGPELRVYNILPFANSGFTHRLTVFGINAGINFKLDN